MKAIVYTKYGSPDVLQYEEVPKPAPKENEVLIKVHAASINSWDWDQLLGKHFIVRLIGGLFKPRYKILGADIAGRVEAIGNKVTQFQTGDEVFGDIAGCGFGGFAEYVAVPERLLARKSPAISFEQAAALPQAGLLALQGLRHNGDLKSEQLILINGAGGGVGTLALQYAKSCGAEVTCVDIEEKFDMLRSLGADHLIDYTKEDYTRSGQQYDKILDVIAHRSVSDYKRALKPGGSFVMIGGSMGWLLVQLMLFGSIISKFGNKKLGLMGYRPNRNDLNTLSRLFEEGKVIPVIDCSYPLQETAEAFRYFGTGRVKGKIIITMGQS
jgi:NADPH:quinone reductase-like Zn-dependent oxidoreductase